MKPKTLITVFGKYPGIVIPPGKVKGPDDYVRVEYRGEHGMQIAAWVPLKDVKERT